MMIFFIITHFAVDLNVSSSVYHKWIGFASIGLVLLSTFGIRKIAINWKKVLFMLVYVAFTVYLSSRYTLGEQMGDSIYLFNVVNKNIDIEVLNAFDLRTGLVDLSLTTSLTKSYISFYMIFASLYYYAEPIIAFFGIQYLPPYVLNMWVTNLIFYFFSAGFILDLLAKFKLKTSYTSIILILWLGLYTGSIYYNITFPHIVVTYLVLFLAFLVLALFSYFQTYERKQLLKIFIILYGMSGFAGTGVLYLIVFAFAIIATTLVYKHKDIFIQVPLFLVPILEYVLIVYKFKYINYIVLIGYSIILFISYLLYRNETLQKLVFNIRFWILGLLWMVLFIFSLRTVDHYYDKALAFFLPQFGADRTQDYFSYNSIDLAIRNMVYICFIIVMIKDKMFRPIGVVITVILLFFVNPLMKPWVAENLARYDVYNRIFFTVFNNGTIGLGIIAAIKWIKQKQIKYEKPGFIIIILIMLIPTWSQITGYYYPSYEPQVEDFNPLYKMGESQIEILEKIRQIVVIEKLDNPRLISQIFGTGMYAPEFVTLGYNVNQQRNGPIFIGEELYMIFYTPAIPGDHRPVIDYDLRGTCKLLVDKAVDFVIVDKSFSVYDKEVGDYLTIYWYLDRCGATFIDENDDYIAYRFFRW